MYQHIKVPAQGQKITVNADNSLNVPDEPIIPFIEGDGTGADITPVMLKVVDAAVAKAYGGKKKIHWMEVYAGEKSTRIYGPDVWLPEETLAAVKDYVVSIKGPLTTPVGGGIRSLNVALRQELDLASERATRSEEVARQLQTVADQLAAELLREDVQLLLLLAAQGAHALEAAHAVLQHADLPVLDLELPLQTGGFAVPFLHLAHQITVRLVGLGDDRVQARNLLLGVARLFASGQRDYAQE